ncbi:myoD family inhibitor isoform X2 [Mugil cephalus]|nr:myoD family inhibitor isoform X2 [Mugil cephalus]
MMMSHWNNSDVTEGGANKDPGQSRCIMSQPTANGKLPHQSTDVAAPPPPPPPPQDTESSDDSLTDSSSSTSDSSRLLSSSSSASCPGVHNSSASPPPPPQSTCNRHHHPPHPQHRPSTTKSSASLKTDAAHIKEVAGDDCCVHCVLACLFCELLSMCSAVGECLACGVGGAGCCDAAIGCCCCVEVAGEAACTEEACQAVLECGLLEDCCASSDCLEICLECCSICFPA